MPSNWGMDFTVGAVPVFKYLESRDVDEVGYTLRTASLMTGPESRLRRAQPGRLRAVRDPLPDPPVRDLTPGFRRRSWRSAARTRSGPPATTGYVHAGAIVGPLAANRTDLGARSIPLLHSGLAQYGEYLEVGFDRIAGARPGHCPCASRGASAGTVTSESDDLEQGSVIATVTMRRPGRGRDERLVRRRLDRDRRRSPAADDDGRAGAGRDRRPGRNAHRRLSLSGVLRLPGAVCAVRADARRVRRRRRRPPATSQIKFSRSHRSCCRGARSCRRSWRRTAGSSCRWSPRRRTPPGGPAGS